MIIRTADDFDKILPNNLPALFPAKVKTGKTWVSLTCLPSLCQAILKHRSKILNSTTKEEEATTLLLVGCKKLGCVDAEIGSLVPTKKCKHHSIPVSCERKPQHASTI